MGGDFDLSYVFCVGRVEETGLDSGGAEGHFGCRQW
jgi:hypothetical protein